MPLYKKIVSDNSQIGIWRIEEDLSFFAPQFNSHPDIKNENKKLQWFATRHLLNQMVGEPVEVDKDENGKPHLKNTAYHISISHTAELAAVIINAYAPVGLDLEMVNPKVERIAHKFLRDDEIAAINPNEKIEKLILYFSAKEALYKFYGKGKIEFKTQLLIKPFELKLKGELDGEIIVPEGNLTGLKVNYEFFEDHVLSYITG